MNLLADEGVDRPVVEPLRQDGHDVLYVAESSPSVPDEEVLQQANTRSAVLLTADKDFGELVFRQGLVHSGVVLLRLAGLANATKAELVAEVCRIRSAELIGAFSVIVEINCDLLLSLGCAGSSYASDGDYSWIERRFGIRAVETLGGRAFLQRAAEEMRQRAFVDSSDLAVALSNHFEARITDLQEAIGFILENTEHFGSPAEVFRASQYRSAVNRGEAPPAPMPPATYEARFGLQVLDDLLARRGEIPATAGRIDAFRTYSVLETTLELFEDDVHSLASEVDRAIQWAVDIASGK